MNDNGIIATLDGFSIVYYEIRQKQTVEIKTSHKDSINCLALNENQKLMASAALDKSIKVFHLVAKKELISFSNVHQDKISCLEFSMNGNLLITGSFDRSIKIFDLNSGLECLHLKNIHECAITSLILSTDHKLIFSGSNDCIKMTEICESNLYKSTQLKIGLEGQIKCLDRSSDNRMILVGYPLGQVALIDIISGQHHKLTFYPNEIAAVNLSSHNQYLLIGLDDNSIIIHKLQTRIQLKKFIWPEAAGVICKARIVENSNSILACTSKGEVKMIDLNVCCDATNLRVEEDINQSVQIHTLENQIDCTLIDPYNHFMVIGSKNGSIKVIRYQNGETILTLENQLDKIIPKGICLQKGTLAISYQNRSIHVIDLTHFYETRIIESSYGGINTEDKYLFILEQTSTIIITLDSSKIIVGSSGGSIKVFCIITQKVLCEFLDAHEGPISSLALFQNYTLLASGSATGTIKVHDLKSLKEAFSLRSHHESNDSSDRKIQIFDLKTLQSIKELTISEGKVISALMFLRNFNYLVLGLSDGSIEILDCHSIQKICHLKDVFPSPIISLCATMGEDSIIAISKDRSVKLVDTLNLLDMVCSLSDSSSKNFFSLLKLIWVRNCVDKCENSDDLSQLLNDYRDIFLARYKWNILHLISIYATEKDFTCLSYSKFKVPMILDIAGRSPINYLLASKVVNFRLVKFMLKYLVEFLEDTSGTIFDHYQALVGSISPMIPLLLYRIESSLMIRFFSCCIVPPTTCAGDQLPHYGIPKGNRTNFATVESPIFTQTVKFLTIEDDQIQNGHILDIKSCLVYLNYHPYSLDMLSFSLALQQSQSQEIFKHKLISILIDYLWMQSKYFHLSLAILFSILIICFSFYTSLSTPSSQILRILMLGLGSFFSIYEFYHILISGFKAYLNDIWNWIDILYYITLLMAIVLGNEDIDNNIKKKWLFSFCIVLGYIRWVSYLRIFDQASRSFKNYIQLLGSLIRVLLEIIKEMKSFMVLLIMMLFGFSLAFYQFNREKAFGDQLLNVYNLLYAVFDIEEFSNSEILVFALIAFFLSVVLLNLLIAIMNGAYERVQNHRIYADSKEILEMIIETNVFLRQISKIKWFQRFQILPTKSYLIFVEKLDVNTN